MQSELLSPVWEMALDRVSFRDCQLSYYWPRFDGRRSCVPLADVETADVEAADIETADIEARCSPIRV